MKSRESGMPEQKMWNNLFNIEMILNKMEINNSVKSLVDFGCGYGTFAIPASELINGNVYALDIETELIEKLSGIAQQNFPNLVPINLDFIQNEIKIENDLVNYVMLFNILHAEESEILLKKAFKLLENGGKLGVIHWIFDEKTPRGPSMKIRPKPEELKNKIEKVGFKILKYNITLPPYHFGILAEKP